VYGSSDQPCRSTVLVQVRDDYAVIEKILAGMRDQADMECGAKRQLSPAQVGEQRVASGVSQPILADGLLANTAPGQVLERSRFGKELLVVEAGGRLQNGGLFRATINGHDGGEPASRRRRIGPRRLEPACPNAFDSLSETDALDAHDQRHDIAADAAAVAPPRLRLLLRVHVEVRTASIHVQRAAADEGAALAFQLDRVPGGDLLKSDRLLQGTHVDWDCSLERGE
jgi:hypothetical protein